MVRAPKKAVLVARNCLEPGAHHLPRRFRSSSNSEGVGGGTISPPMRMSTSIAASAGSCERRDLAGEGDARTSEPGRHPRRSWHAAKQGTGLSRQRNGAKRRQRHDARAATISLGVGFSHAGPGTSAGPRASAGCCAPKGLAPVSPYSEYKAWACGTLGVSDEQRTGAHACWAAVPDAALKNQKHPHPGARGHAPPRWESA